MMRRFATAGLFGALVAWGAACLNPRPEEFPSNETGTGAGGSSGTAVDPPNASLDPAGENDGLSGAPNDSDPDVPDPVVPGNEGNGIADAGAPAPDGGLEDAGDGLEDAD